MARPESAAQRLAIENRYGERDVEDAGGRRQRTQVRAVLDDQVQPRPDQVEGGPAVWQRLVRESAARGRHGRPVRIGDFAGGRGITGESW